MSNYKFNLCPHNSLYPGYYDEKITDFFHSGCLPITWCDSNVNHDFNSEAFVNLLVCMGDNYKNICN